MIAPMLSMTSYMTKTIDSMEEFELYSRILSDDFKCKNQTVLYERKSGQRANIEGKGIDRYELYRFDAEEGKDFLPFFNNRHNHGGKVPERLRAFCDYIILVSCKGNLYIVLVEMKSGKENASQQLDASQVFMEYVKNSALRIKDVNHYHSFDVDNIKEKQLLLKKGPKVKNRPTTQPAKNTAINWDAVPIVLREEKLPLRKICR